MKGVSNYYLEHANIAGIPHFSSVRAAGILPGVDIVYHGSNRELEYDFVLSPGTNPASIRLQFDKTSAPTLGADGDLAIRLATGTLVQRRPIAWQEINGKRHYVECRYRLSSAGIVGFVVGPYDRTSSLLIDPILSYSTYLGGSANDEANGIAVDGSGNAVVVGSTSSLDFTASARARSADSSDAFAAKLNASGTALVYVTVFGGSQMDIASAVAVDADGNAYVAGQTESGDFPSGSNPSYKAPDAFVMKLSTTGAMIYSTQIGGAAYDAATAVAVNASGEAFITGIAGDGFPVTASAYRSTFQGSSEAFLTKLNASGGNAYSTYIGGNSDDAGAAVALSVSGQVYVAGTTSSSTFPTTGRQLQGGSDAFVTLLNIGNSGSAALVNSIVIGGTSNDQVAGLALDGDGNCYLAGRTVSADYPVTAGAYLIFNPVGYLFSSGFVTKLSPDLATLRYSTYLGGTSTSEDKVTSIAVTSAGIAHVAGLASSSSFPTTPGALKGRKSLAFGTYDVFYSQLSTDGSTLLYSTLVGEASASGGRTGIAIDGVGGVYLVGSTSSPLYPTTPGAYQVTMPKPAGSSLRTAFISKIDTTSPTACTASVSPSFIDVPGRGGQFPVTLTLPPGCPWEARSNSFIEIQGVAKGMGSATPIEIFITVRPHSGVQSGRAGLVSIGDATLTVNQAAGSCSDPVFTPSALTFDSAGGTKNVAVMLADGCPWSSSITAGWLQTNSGIGSGSLAVVAAANSFGQRTGNVIVAGTAIPVTQAAGSCVAQVTAASVNVGAAPGLATVTITTGPSCAWTVSSAAPWITPNEFAGQGTRTIAFQYSANPAYVARTGQLMIADKVVTVVQATGPAGTVEAYSTVVFAGTGTSNPVSIGDGGPATAASLNPWGLRFDTATGSLIIADNSNRRIRRVSSDGLITTIAGGGVRTGEGVAASSASLGNLADIALDKSTPGAFLFIEDNRIRRVVAGVITTVAGGASAGFSGDGSAAIGATLSAPGGIDTNAAGEILIADTGNNRIRQVSSGIINTVAGGAGFNAPLGDGGPGISARLVSPNSVMVDAEGRVLVADTWNHRIRRMNQGVISTIAGGGANAGDGGLASAASLSYPFFLATNAGGSLFFTSNGQVRKIDPAGVITTIANIPNAAGIAADPEGNVYVAGNNRVYKLIPVTAFCTYQLSTPSPVGSAGGVVTLSVTAAAGCAWTATSDSNWAPITAGASGTGNGSVTLNVAPISAGSRTAELFIAGRRVSLIQSWSQSAGPRQLFLQSRLTNAVSIWTMTGATSAVIGSAPVTAVAAPNWTVRASGDLNSDGIRDVILQNTQTNQVSVWFMNAQGAIALAPVVGIAAAGWHIVAAADMNRDFITDFVLQHATTNQISIWFMLHNATGFSSAPIIGASAPGWRLVAAGHVNSDDTPDILLQNATTNQLSVWFMNAGGTSYSSAPIVASPAVGWSVLGTSDFNFDSIPDYILQNRATGAVSVWYMTGSQGDTYSTAPVIAVAAPGWDIRGVH